MAGLLEGDNGGAGVSPINFNGEGGDDQQAPNAEQATPEEQQQYDQFVTNGFKILYGTKQGDGPVQKDILGRLKAGSDPVQALAQTAVWLTMMVENSAEQSGAQVPDDVVFHGGKALMEELVQISEAAGIHDYSQKEMQGAWYSALDMYREANTQGPDNQKGRMNPDDLRAQFQQLDDADRVGQGASVVGMDPARAAQEADAAAGMDDASRPQPDQQDGQDQGTANGYSRRGA